MSLAEYNALQIACAVYLAPRLNMTPDDALCLIAVPFAAINRAKRSL